ncbi:MAG: 3-hydroxybutyryl-CoA dehydrogenase [Spirochaetes bacterium]|nr:3-hydroxybutyryl-CoA dehydrogenase [Spirochaetota bacterium]
MKADTINTIGVVGAGQMGSGIACVAAVSGFTVILYDLTEELALKGVTYINGVLSKDVAKGKITQDEKQRIMERIRATCRFHELADADFVVEAATENQDIKLKIFKDLDTICRPKVICATNTSSIPIGRIAAATKRPDKIIGMHFMNPVPVMKLVEIIRALPTSQETFDVTWELSLKLGKTPAEAHDYPGFISNRILMPMINEAIYSLYEGVGTRESIDTVMKLGMNHPMGPLALADLIGLDTCLAIMETLYDGFKDSKYRPCPLLRRYVESGWLGRKTGKGFYDYT